MIIGDVMDEVGTQLNTITGIDVLPYDADSVNPPCAIVSLPPSINYLSTYKRGMDKLVLEVSILVSMADDRIRREEITPFADGSGPQSVKEVLESGTYTAFDTLAVRSGGFMVISIEGIEYLGAVFQVDISGQGG